MPKMVRNRSALHDVLAQGASNRDITVFIYDIKAHFDINWYLNSTIAAIYNYVLFHQYFCSMC